MDLHATLTQSRTGQSGNNNRRRKKLGMYLAAGAIALAIVMFATSSNSSNVISASSLITAEVKEGQFDVVVFGYGRLKPKHQRLLTSDSRATVETIHLYPGAPVTRDTVILTLSAPQVQQEAQQAKLELARVQAEFQSLQIQHQSELLERDAQIALLDSELENAKLRAEAEQQLVENGIVSTLDYKRTQLNVAQLSKRLDIEHTRREQLLAMQKQRTLIQRDLVSQFQINYDTHAERANDLNVTAGLDGVLQRLPVDIGQSVSPGEPLATVGSTTQLLAEVSVPQIQADTISHGMSGAVLTDGIKIAASVTRIDPVVTDGRVMVELELKGTLPVNARPDLTVEGHINTSQFTHTLFSQQPANIAANDRRPVFVLKQGQNIATRTPVTFGAVSGNHIQILDGVMPGDHIVVSDMTDYAEQTSITVQ